MLPGVNADRLFIGEIIIQWLEKQIMSIFKPSKELCLRQQAV